MWATPPAGFTVTNVRDAGAKVDGRRVLDGAMTAGSAVLASASGLFAAADVGKLVSVDGAGTGTAAQGGAAGLVAAVVSYQSPTQVTLSAAASTTVAGAQTIWGTDDRVAVQACINAAQTAGGTVFFPPGWCVVSGIPGSDVALSVTGPVALLGVPGQSVIYCPTILTGGTLGQEAYGIFAPTAPTADIDGMIFYGLTLMNNQTVPYDVYWAGLALIYSGNSVHYLLNLAITRCRFITRTRCCIALSRTRGFSVSHNVMDSMAETGIYLAGNDNSDGEIAFNRMGATLAVTAGDGLSVRQCHRVRMHDNLIDGAANNAIFFRDNNITDTDVYNNTITNGTSPSSGIAIANGNRISVRGNRIYNQPQFGITVNGTAQNGASITDLTISDNDVVGCALYGIQVLAGTLAPVNVAIVNNRLWDNVEGLTTDGLKGTVVVRDNVIVSTAGGNGNYGLAVFNAAGSAVTVVKDNVTRGYTPHTVDAAAQVIQANNDFVA